MFEGLVKPKFYTKCKSYLRLTKTRLETIKKKRKAVQKYLKNDIIELLRSGLDINAYGRAEGLLVEQNMSSCYEVVEKFCRCVYENFSVLHKQRECPEECKEAVQSLMYAAARFADLPELRDLRTLFTEKYGNSLESYINKEFVEKLRQSPPTKEMKIQLLHDIARESSIEWDSKALEQKLHTPPPVKERPMSKSLSGADDEEWDENNDGAIATRYNLNAGNKQKSSRSERKDSADNGYRLQSSSEDETSTDMSSQDGPKTSSVGSVSEDEVDNKKAFYYRFIPPPYLKSKPDKNESNLEKPTKSAPLAERESNQDHNEPVVEDKPKPRSVRRRNLKPPPGFGNFGNSEGGGDAKENSSGAKSEDAKQRRQTLYSDDSDSRDEEERIMDGLLMHYSKKPSPYESGKAKPYAKDNESQQVDDQTGEHRRYRKSDPEVPPFQSSIPPGQGNERTQWSNFCTTRYTCSPKAT
ncbi:putative Regulator of Vps4 activity in the MVB pathway protein [Quillaja saponaria]|uniref:Regulator of Vps4 activity in the MVB pathway protein n=1 Tax=Quillaja saponaria TaxID=32244 RepID=A0AAD7PDQ4_QUISA|nr:putative Regulator of Vps4 activity in the MVB pathway protein [Quillaja saponaria]